MKFSKRAIELPVKALQALLGGMSIGAACYVLAQILPLYFKNYEFEQAMRNEVRIGTANWRPTEAITEDVWEKAHDLGLPVGREEITVSSDKKPVPIPFPGYTFYWNFHLHSDNHRV